MLRDSADLKLHGFNTLQSYLYLARVDKCLETPGCLHGTEVQQQVLIGQGVAFKASGQHYVLVVDRY